MADENDVDQRIRETAFRLWQEAGSPEGRHEEFWYRAREIELSGKQSTSCPSLGPKV
jgi:hypothetical protein